MKYHIWTIGCQMNKSESSEIADHLDLRGFKSTNDIKEADLVILNTCVVRQHAEDKVKSMLGYMKHLRRNNAKQHLVVTGCFVPQGLGSLQKKYPIVDLFFAPGDIRKFDSWIDSSISIYHSPAVSMPGSGSSSVSVYIPIMQGCDNYCSYCIVPYRRGRERSLSRNEIMSQARNLIVKGAREVILLGQNVNSYGKGLEERIDLADLLTELNQIDDLYRIRFLTNHPKDVSNRLIHAIATLDKICHHICLPLQSGDDHILSRMNRNYTFNQYKSIVDELRTEIPDISFSTDIIVGFPGETEAQFSSTYNAILELCYDAVHVAAYSPRAETKAGRDYMDDVPKLTKQERLHRIEELQKKILNNTNNSLLNTTVEILVEGKKGTKWYGRTYNDKLVYAESESDLHGRLVWVKISAASPWSLQGTIIS